MTTESAAPGRFALDELRALLDRHAGETADDVADLLDEIGHVVRRARAAIRRAQPKPPKVEPATPKAVAAARGAAARDGGRARRRPGPPGRIGGRRRDVRDELAVVDVDEHGQDGAAHRGEGEGRPAGGAQSARRTPGAGAQSRAVCAADELVAGARRARRAVGAAARARPGRAAACGPGRRRNGRGRDRGRRGGPARPEHHLEERAAAWPDVERRPVGAGTSGRAPWPANGGLTRG